MKDAFIGAYIFYDAADTLRYGAEYGFSDSAETFVREMQEDVVRDFPGATDYEGLAWKMSQQGMSAVARVYVQRYFTEEYGSTP